MSVAARGGLGRSWGHLQMFKRIAFAASEADSAQDALIRLRHLYGSVPLDEADVIVALGGDGFMIATLHMVMERGTPVYGMNRGSV